MKDILPNQNDVSGDSTDGRYRVHCSFVLHFDQDVLLSKEELKVLKEASRGTPAFNDKTVMRVLNDVLDMDGPDRVEGTRVHTVKLCTEPLPSA